MLNFPDQVTIWSNAGRSVTGAPTFGSPQTVNGRWEERQIQFIDSKGVTSVSKAVVYLDGTDVAPGDWLYFGASVAAEPPANSYAVRQFDRVPDLRRIRTERKAIL